MSDGRVDHAGLSTCGRKVVHGLDEQRMVINVSHFWERTNLEAIWLVKGPVVTTHAAGVGVHDKARKLSDEQIRVIAASDCVIGLCGFPTFIAPDDPPSLDQMIDHSVYIGDLVGAEHIGLGLDFAIEDEDEDDYFGYDPRPPWPVGLGGFFRDAPNISAALLRRGFSEHDVRGVPGEDFLRVFQQVWGA